MTKTRNRLISVGIAFLLFVAAVFVLPQMTAKADAWDGTTIATEFAGGTGTSGDPYLIENGAQFAYLSQQINDGDSTLKSAF